MKNIAIDSDVFIASEIDTEPNYNESKKFIEYIKENKLDNVFFFTSIFTLLELASAMIRRTENKDKAYSLLYQVTKSWKSFINPLPLSSSKKQVTSSAFSKELIDNFIETSIKFHTKSGDTIQTQAILENQIDCFITWNKRDFIILEKSIPNFKVFTPTEILNEIEVRRSIPDLSKDCNEMINIIREQTKLSKNEIEKRIKTKIERLSGLISDKGAAQVIAAELGVIFPKK